LSLGDIEASGGAVLVEKQRNALPLRAVGAAPRVMFILTPAALQAA
jgi:hypothetical protein